MPGTDARPALAYRLRVLAALALVLGLTLGVATVAALVPVAAVLLVLEVAAPSASRTGWWLLLVPPAVVVAGTLEEVRYAGALCLDRTDATAVPADEHSELHELVARLAGLLDVPAPRLAIAETTVPEAMVVGAWRRRTTLVLSTGLLEALDRDELSAVVAHELAHVAARDAAVATIAAVPALLAESVYDARSSTAPGEGTQLVHGPAGWLVVRLSWLAWRIASPIAARLGREREYRADRLAATVTGDPGALAAALERIDRRLESAPDADLRAVGHVGSLSIVAPPPVEAAEGPVRLGPDGDRTRGPSLRRRVRRTAERSARFHPPTDARRERLLALAAERGSSDP